MVERSIRSAFDADIVKRHFRDRPSEAEREQMELAGLERRREELKRLLDADDELYILSRCVGIAATWFSFLVGGLLAELGDLERKDEPDDEQVAALAFFSRLANDLFAIIELVEAGFDLQARALTRSYLEHVDVLICCILDRETTKEFAAAIEPEASNAFWHRNVSKNKAKARVSKFISETLGREVDIVQTLREDADLFGSSLLHPTMAAGMAAAFGDSETDYGESYPIFPKPIAASAGVYRSILIHHLWLSFAMGRQPHAWSGPWRPLFRTVYLLKNKEIERRRDLYADMFSFLLDHQLLMQPKDDLDGNATIKE